MNNFEQNYWASYCDFINDFKRLSYLGICIPLVCPYYVLVNENKDIIQALQSKSLKTFLKTPLDQERQIQSTFETHLSPFKQKIIKRKGKVVFHDNVLRFPDQLLKAHFDPSNSVLLKLKTNKYGKDSDGPIPIDNLDRYQSITENTIKSYQRKANKYLDAAKPHPIYKNKLFRTRFIKQIPSIMRQIVAAKKFFESNTVSCLVLGTTNSSDTRILALVASAKGIPTICLQHGVIMLEFGYLPKIATYQAVYGKYEMDWYAAKGVPANSLKSIGHPRFDEITSRKAMGKKAFQTHYGLNAANKTILLVIHHLETEFPQSILQRMGKEKNINIIVKQRNGKQRKSEKTLQLQKKFPHIKFANDMHLYDLLHNVDAVVSYESTIVLEAMLAEKPVFIWRLNNLSLSSTDYYSDLEEYVYGDPSQMVKSLMKVLQGQRDENWEKKRKQFLAYYYPHIQGGSSRQLKSLVDSITL